MCIGIDAKSKLDFETCNFVSFHVHILNFDDCFSIKMWQAVITGWLCSHVDERFLFEINVCVKYVWPTRVQDKHLFIVYVQARFPGCTPQLSGLSD